MSTTLHSQPKLLSQINERSVFRVLQQHGPCSRADVTRLLGVTAPTVSKAVTSLLQGGMVEEYDHRVNERGRPAKRLRLATESAQVLGLVIDARECQLVSAGLDGKLCEESSHRFKTPATYRSLISTAVKKVMQLLRQSEVSTLGLGISLPGLIDYRHQKGILSPNVPITNQQSPARDLSEKLGIDCVMLQEAHALCVAERHYGETKGLDEFAMLDISTGLGLGIVTGGRMLSGHSGLAGEIGHIPREADGRLCGCGKRGCLETLSSDTAVAAFISERIERTVDIDEVIRMTNTGEISPEQELDQILPHLAFSLSTVISLFNPSTLFISGRLFELDEGFFDRLLAATAQCTLEPSFADCKIIRAKGSKRQGAVAGILESLTDALVPGMDGFLSERMSHNGNGRNTKLK